MIRLGTYTEGEIPEPLEYQFLDAGRQPLDLTGFTATFSLQIVGEAATSTDAVVGDNGKVTHVWSALEPGIFYAEFVVTNGTNTYISERLHGVVRKALVPPA